MIFDQSFEKAFANLMKLEGGYVNNPNDLGGETKFGFSKRSHPDIDIKNLTLEHAKYKCFNEYWIPMKCNIVNSYYVSEKMLDICFHMGIKKATILLQRALRASTGIKLEEDGINGLQTTNATLKAKPELLYIALKCEAAAYYRLIVQARPDQKENFIGWLNRAYG